MRFSLRQIVFGLGLALFPGAAPAADMTIHLLGSGPITAHQVTFQCDAQGVKIGLPAGPFTVNYINGAGNSLAVVPIGGKSLIFANVISGSGARYASGIYIWWDAGPRGTTLYSDSIAGKDQSSCTRITRTSN